MRDIEKTIKELKILVNKLPSISDDEKDAKNKILIKLEELKEIVRKKIEI